MVMGNHAGMRDTLRRYRALLLRISRKAQEEISRRKRAEDRIRALTQELIRKQESDRQRIARGLHDHLAQDLSSLRIACETIFDGQSGVSEGARRRLTEISGVLRESIRLVRDLENGLHSPGLEQLGLVRSLFLLCEDFSRETGIHADFSAAGMDPIELCFETKINLYRIVQEALARIGKHGEASRVLVRLTASFPSIILRVEENGKTFHADRESGEMEDCEPVGLCSVQERALLLGGAMRLRSFADRGTGLIIEIPYSEKEND